jgi:hypothetical protein
MIVPKCNNCKKYFHWIIVVNGKEIDLRKRKYCLDCNPLGEHNFWKGKRVQKGAYDKNSSVKNVEKQKYKKQGILFVLVAEV